MCPGILLSEVVTVLKSAVTTLWVITDRKKLEYNQAVFSPGDSKGGNKRSRLLLPKMRSPFSRITRTACALTARAAKISNDTAIHTIDKTLTIPYSVCSKGIFPDRASVPALKNQDEI